MKMLYSNMNHTLLLLFHHSHTVTPLPSPDVIQSRTTSQQDTTTSLTAITSRSTTLVDAGAISPLSHRVVASGVHGGGGREGEREIGDLGGGGVGEGSE